MSYPGLSLDQAPPIGAPFRFFITAPLFGLAAAAMLAWLGPDVLVSRWTPAALAVTHLVTLGVLTMVMFGALLQMLPVVVGAPVARPLAVAGVVHGTLSAGCAALAVGFLLSSAAWMRGAGLLLAAGIALLVGAALLSLVRAPRRHAALQGMALAVVALAVAAALGLWLLAGHGWEGVVLRRGALTDLHAGWAMLGWVGILVAGVAFQVVPMFQLTPEYPAWLARWINPFVATLLLLWSATLVWPVLAPLGLAAGVLLGAAGVTFALVTLDLQRRRKRRLPDTTLAFWRLAMGVLLGVVALWLAGRLLPAWGGDPRHELLLGGFFLGGYALSVINGMLYKIVPFLVWFHLQSRLVTTQLISQGHRVPNMKQVLPSAVARRQYHAHLVAVALLAPALLWPAPFVYPLALAFAVSFALLARNLWSASLLFRREWQRLEEAAAASDR